ncbi:beta-galactosidase [Lachnospiraceae bacterium ASD3451]|uniref:beta-galactosidase n=1 Tax=Diplocloster agilis TaxID=2850323 RepID=UPI001D7949C3|nr:beta-galactosidase [Diplocloster agilis]MBU9745472.1 beta-galactosidase [Diplocloster agilis]
MEYHIDTAVKKTVRRGHLRMGGADPKGNGIEANSQYLTYNQRPWIPVMGEFHYSRNPVEYWEEDLLKCKAAGIQVISSYVFWIHHEEEEGKFCFTGSRDIRKFVELCGKLGLGFFLRLGPWVHGECRNGGHPDWIYEKCSHTRCNDETYLFYTKRLYTELAGQLDGLFFRDGGPIIGIQVDNELIREPEHLGTLKKMARECGMEAPVWTVTGWGHHGGTRFPQDEFIPMFGGYPEGPWEQHIKPLAPSIHYQFREDRNDADIGVDVLALSDTQGYEGAADFSRYPFATCETGTGIPVTYHRRPVIHPDDAGAMTLTGIGSGNNLVGYFMFKGGTSPKAGKTTYNETKDTGYLNNFPTLSNDFQAPVSDFGEIRDVYKVLKRFNLFLGDFGEILAVAQPYFPADSADVADAAEAAETAEAAEGTLIAEQHGDSGNEGKLRYCVRDGEEGGFLFVNNYVRLERMPERKNTIVCIQRTGETIQIPLRIADRAGITIPADSYFFFPFALELGGSKLLYATAQPLCRYERKGREFYLFYNPRGMVSEYYFQDQLDAAFDPERMEKIRIEEGTLLRVRQAGMECMADVKTADGRTIGIITLSQEEADNCWKETEECRFLAEGYGDDGIPCESVYGEQKESRPGQDRALNDSGINRDARKRIVICKEELFFRDQKIHIRTAKPGGCIWILGNEGAANVERPGKEVVEKTGIQGNEKPENTKKLVPIGKRGEFYGYAYEIEERMCAAVVWKEEPADEKLSVNYEYLRTEKTGGWDVRQWDIKLQLPKISEGEDLILTVDYLGDAAHLYLGERLIADDYCKGIPWRIGLKRFYEELKEQKLTLQILPLAKEQPVYLERFLERREEELVRLGGIHAEWKKEVLLSF